MNSYLIQKAVRTPAHLFVVLDYPPFRFIPGVGCGFVAEAQLKGRDFREAFQDFMSELNPMLSVISVLTQCPVYSTGLSSYLVYRMNDNSGQIGFFYYVGETPAVGMPFHEDELSDLKRVLGHEEWKSYEVAFGYLRQANLAESPIAWLGPLLMAVEAFAGEAVVHGNCKHCGAAYQYFGMNKEGLKAILGKVLFGKLYGSGRLRHKLFHGGEVREGEISTVAEQVYRRVVLDFVKKKFALTSLHEIVNAPRTSRYESLGIFVELKGRTIGQQTLRELERDHEELISVDEPMGY